MFIVDRELWPILEEALAQCSEVPEIVIVDDLSALSQPDLPKDYTRFEDLINQGRSDYEGEPLEDEWQALSLNYTSGTTGVPL